MVSQPTRRTFLKSTAAAAAVLPAGSLAAAPSGKIKIGQIGVGHGHARGKMKVYRASEDFEVVGVVEPNPKLRASVENSATYRGLRWMTQEEILNTPGLQAVAVETEVAGLLDHAEPCVAAGKHLHLDKPAGESLPRFKRLLDNATRQSLTIQMGYMYRYNPGMVLLKDLLAKGWLGEPFEIQTVMGKRSGAAARKGWEGFSGGGMMFELGCHLIDTIVKILGRPPKVDAYQRHSSPIPDELNDNSLAVFAYPKALVTVRSSVNEVSGFDRRHFVLCGTKGTVHIQPIDSPSVRLVFDEPREGYKKGYQEIVFGDYDRYVEDAKDFAKIIRGEKQTDYSPEHDYTVQETVLRAAGMPLT